MFYGDTIQDTRQLFFSSWEKFNGKMQLSALENQIAQVIQEHPEYHFIFNKKEPFIEQAYYPELGQTNPFLHMGLHLAVREQIATNRPDGIQASYNQLLAKYQDSHSVEHMIMEQLAECLWLSQKNNTPPDEANYLNLLSKL
ncbi:DUF1841 family protein [Legionella waltersii]|uniref:DUF1841 domain-containing protein n=1 Tax=Legionella waltersii TaxID=66969 RepID=A0A0W1A4W3_9GAMM|nr:DUF1841 family protein [Legionella waltersii]KTD76407.1 hypothetical protein Lwal_2129 [Legionella waltersii]SNV14290.1 Domain of uncharacterised function (DUF1841) [Legionella waltersii]